MSANKEKIIEIESIIEKREENIKKYEKLIEKEKNLIKQLKNELHVLIGQKKITSFT